MITQTMKTSLLMKQEENLILRQNDVGNDIVFIFDNNLTDITSAEFRLIKPDNTFVILTGIVEGNTATFTITGQCCTIPGRCHFNLRLINANSNIYTYVSNCIIDINLNLEDAIESTAEANGYTFPDDFALKKEIPDTDDFATKKYVDTAIASIPVYTPVSYSLNEQNTGLKWVDGKDIYQKSIYLNGAINLSTNATTISKTYFDVSVVDTFINALAIRCNHGNIGTCVTHASAWKDGVTFKVYGSTIVNSIDYLNVQYTKN